VKSNLVAFFVMSLTFNRFVLNRVVEFVESVQCF